MPELPGPPDHYDDRQRAAWLAGAATVANLLSQQQAVIAETYADDSEDLEVEDSDGADANDDEDSCPECGGALIGSFGGRYCLECGHET